MTTAATPSQEVVLADDEPIGLALIRALEEEGELKRSALKILNPNMTVQQYEVFLAVFGEFKRTCSFAIGDLINFGEDAFPDDEYHERYERAVALTGLKYETLRNYASVCGRVAVPRRRDRLSFGHHETVASLEPHLQTEWLLAAEEKGWSRSELREHLRDANVLKPQSQLQWAGGKIGGLAHEELEPPPARPADANAPPPASPQEPLPGAVAAPPAVEPTPGEVSLAEAVRVLLSKAELVVSGDYTYYQVPRKELEDVEALVELWPVKEAMLTPIEE